jgi:hypothetical protein
LLVPGVHRLVTSFSLGDYVVVCFTFTFGKEVE